MPSAAQNGPVLINCQKCGASNSQHADACYVCNAWLDVTAQPAERESNDSAELARDILKNIPLPESASEPEPEPVPVLAQGAEPEPEKPLQHLAAPPQPVPQPIRTRTPRPQVVRTATAEAPIAEIPLPEPSRAPAPESVLAAPPAPAEAPGPQPEWRRELSDRVEKYRERRRQSSEEPQSDLPFVADSAEAADPTGTRAADQELRASLRLTARRRTEHMEILAIQPELDFSLPLEEQEHPQARLVPVAELWERRHAGVRDAGFVLLAYVAFLVLFGSLGGQFKFGKMDAVVYAATLFLFYAQYFALFTAFGGSTPGMWMCGLHVVSFDGGPASSRQLLWRCFGYLISGATLLLGFLWSLWDEDHLTWQDRISQTYVTSAPAVSATSEDDHT